MERTSDVGQLPSEEESAVMGRGWPRASVRAGAGRLTEKASVEPERRHSEAAAAAQMAEMDGAKRMENRSVGGLVYCYGIYLLIITLLVLVASRSGGHGQIKRVICVVTTTRVTQEAGNNTFMFNLLQQE